MNFFASLLLIVSINLILSETKTVLAAGESDGILLAEASSKKKVKKAKPKEVSPDASESSESPKDDELVGASKTDRERKKSAYVYNDALELASAKYEVPLVQDGSRQVSLKFGYTTGSAKYSDSEGSDNSSTSSGTILNLRYSQSVTPKFLLGAGFQNESYSSTLTIKSTLDDNTVKTTDGINEFEGFVSAHASDLLDV